MVSGPQVDIDNSPYRNEQDLFKLEFLGDNRRTLNGDYESLSSGGMSLLLAATDRESVGLSLEAGVVQLARGSLAAATVTDPSFVEIGVIARHYFTPSHVFLRPYASFNLSYFWMTWDYRTPVLLDDGTSVSWDWIEGVDVSAAVGLAVHLHRNVDLFGEFCGGGVGLVSPTGAGLDNNIFGNFGYVGVKAGFSVVF